MVTESKKKSNAKWDKANMATIGCRLRTAQAAQFKELCAANGIAANTALKNYVVRCLDSGQVVTCTCSSSEDTPLTGGTLQLAQSAAQATGETTAEFISRAVKEQYDRDERNRRLTK